MVYRETWRDPYQTDWFLESTCVFLGNTFRYITVPEIAHLIL